MDILAHALYGATFCSRAGLAGDRAGAPGPVARERTVWAAVAFGLLPDLASIGVAFARALARGATPGFRGLPDYTFALYHLTHSLIVAGLVLLLLRMLARPLVLPALAWPIHILADAFTHGQGRWQTRLFHPFWDFRLPGLDWWRHPWVVIGYWALLPAIWLGLHLWRRGARRDGRCGRPSPPWRAAVALLLWASATAVAADHDTPPADRGARLAAVEAALGPDAPVPRYHALIIGISDYTGCADLPQARPDAERLAGLLRAGYGFESVRALYDDAATRERVLEALYDTALALTPADALLVYYAGHGYYDQAMDTGYWIPSDGREPGAERLPVAGWIADVNIKDILAKTHARHVLVLSDACFSGSLLRTPPDRTALPRAGAWYRLALARPARYVITSGDLQPVPDQSVFTREVLNALRYPRQPVFGASDLAQWIRGVVAEETGCLPRGGPLKGAAGADAGDFIFIARAAVVIPLDAAAAPNMARATETNVSPAVATSAAATPAAIAPAASAAASVAAAPVPFAVDAEHRVVLDEGTCLAFAPVPPGIFMRRDAALAEPQPVRISRPFWLGRTEITNGAFRHFLAASGYAGAAAADGGYLRHFNGDSSMSADAAHPVVWVSWHNAMAFCAWLTAREGGAGRLPVGYEYRLPTATEWAYACQAGVDAGAANSVDAGGVDGALDAMAWYAPNSAGRTQPVATRRANAWGLFDMLGNVAEWCLDAPAPAGVVAATDPRGPVTGARAVRGGAWSGTAAHLRADLCDAWPPVRTGNNIGFRVALAPAP